MGDLPVQRRPEEAAGQLKGNDGKTADREQVEVQGLPEMAAEESGDGPG